MPEELSRAGTQDGPERDGAGGQADGDVAETERSATSAEPPPRGAGPEALALAREAESRGDAESAIGHYREALLADPMSVPARLGLGGLYERRGEHVLALENYDAAREIAEDDVDVLLRVASALGALNRFDRAERELRRAMKLAPGRPEASEQLGLIHFRRGSYAQAEAELRRTLELDPERPQAYFYRGEALNHLNRVDEALEMLERSVRMQPRNAKAYYTMGILYDRKHLREEAEAMYRKAREVADA